MFTGFQGFQGILRQDQVLSPGNQYAFTFSHGRVFEYNSTEWVKEQLSINLSNFGDILSANRPFFSDHYIIIASPSISVSLSDWISAFDAAWQDMGYGSAIFVSAETGTVSSQPGGLPGLVGEATSIVGTGVGTGLSQIIAPIFPYLIIGLAVYVGVAVMIPKLASGRAKRKTRRISWI